ncbi:MAG: AmmeMemoRadiSam system protein B [Rhodobiaceae bacterium]|nr:AmmeMemoRadiSam system protein B [Rhodobiaceae bacterium]
MTAMVAFAVLLIAPGGVARAATDNPFIAPAFNRTLIEAALEKGRSEGPAPVGVTGIIVPHHLLAADLIARGFHAASRGQYDRIVVMAPDHFREVSGRFGTTLAGFETVFGPVASDAEGVRALAAGSGLVDVREDLAQEHGLVGLMPFVRHFFPGVPVVTLIAGVDTTPAQWREAAGALKPLLGERTLVVQSTDFSHYLRHDEAVLRDQQTLMLLASGDENAVAPLLQPDHLDSKAALYMQMRLQREVYASQPVVIANRNSADYGGDAVVTTSYLAAVYLKDPAEGSKLRYRDVGSVFLGGDVLTGRYLLPVLRDEDARDAIVEAVRAATGGAPVVANLEGVILDEPVAGLDDSAHLMVRDIAVPVLQRLNIVAAGLANNHARDLGEIGFGETMRILRAAGVQPLEHGRAIDIGPVRIVAINYIPGRGNTAALYREPGDSAAVCALDAAPPLVALVHWGEEYVAEAGERERAIARQLADCGVAVVAGAHSHQASSTVEMVPGRETAMVFSLGNFLFDQRGDRASAALLELRTFASGTVAARLVSLPNLFELGSAARATPASN